MKTRFLTVFSLSLGMAGPLWAQTKAVMLPPGSFNFLPLTPEEAESSAPVWVSAQTGNASKVGNKSSLQKGILQVGEYVLYGPADASGKGLLKHAAKSAQNLQSLILKMESANATDPDNRKPTKNPDLFYSQLVPFFDALDFVPVDTESAQYLVKADTSKAAKKTAQPPMAMAGSFIPGASVFGAWADNQVWKNQIKPLIDTRQEDIRTQLRISRTGYLAKPWLTANQVMDSEGNVRSLKRNEYIDDTTGVISKRSTQEQANFERSEKEVWSKRKNFEPIKKDYLAGKISDQALNTAYQSQHAVALTEIPVPAAQAQIAIASAQLPQAVATVPVLQTEPSPHIAHLPPFSLPPALPMVELGSAQYAGMISTAKEATLALMGPLSPADAAKVEQRWAGYYAYPADNILQYFRKATPLLSELLNVREAIAVTATSFDRSWSEAVVAAHYESEAYAEAELAQALLLKDYLVALDARARVIAQAMQALGEAPDPIAAQDAAANHHRKSTDTLLGLLKPAAGPEGIWFGAFVEEQERFIEGINEFPLLFIVYAVGPESERRYRALMLDAAEYDEKTDPYIDVLEMHEDEGTPLPALYPHMKNGRINKSLEVTEVDEDGESDTWSTTIKASILPAGGAVQYPEGAGIARAQKAAQATLAAAAKAKEEATGSRGNKSSPANFGAEIGASLGGTIVETFVRSELEDLRRHYELTPAFVAAAKQWLKERPFSEDSTLAEDRALLSSMVASIAGPAKGGKTAAKPVQPAKTAASTKKADEDRKAAEAQAQRERIEFHRHNIRFVEANLAKDRAELAKETDPERRASLEFRIIGELSDIQSEKDLIASIETGELVRTRSPFDDYAHAGFIANIRETQQRMERFQRNTESLLRLAAMLPGVEGQNAREFVERQLTPEVRTKMDEAVVKQVADALGNKVQGYYLGQQAKADEDAALANFGLQAAENIKTAADTGMMVTSLFGGQAIDSTYSAVTGYIEGGPTEAALRTVSSFGPLADSAVQALKGYREGGLEEAAKQGGWAFIKGQGLKYGASKILARVNAGRINADSPSSSKLAADGTPTSKIAADGAPATKSVDGDASLGAARPSALEREALEQFNRARKEGESMVQDLRAAQQRLAEAGSAGRPAAEIAQIQKQIRDKVVEINGNPNAKNYLKYQGDPTTQRLYVLNLEDVHGNVERQFHQNMSEAGWNQQTLKEMRNAASAGSVGMDYDIGLDEAAMKSLTRNGQPAMLHTWQTEAQEAWEQAYAKITGKSAKQAWESVTTSKHAESYRDLAWLGADKSKVSQAWGQQAAEVTRYKSWHMLNEAENLSHFERLQEASRGAAKDFDTKVAPMLDRIKPSAASADSLKVSRAHWEDVRKVLAEFGNNTIDPITANRRIRMLTGGKDIPQVVDEMSTLMEAAIKFGPDS